MDIAFKEYTHIKNANIALKRRINPARLSIYIFASNPNIVAVTWEMTSFLEIIKSFIAKNRVRTKPTKLNSV
ncbi:unnamed protein product, partial [marine sediment metagenome]